MITSLAKWNVWSERRVLVVEAIEMDVLALLGSTSGLGFLSGFRLYATVLALGLAVRFELLTLSKELAGMAILGDSRVLAAAGVLCTIEFLADKVPWLDSLWDGIHMFVRPIAAIALAGTALKDIDSVLETVLALLAGGVALTAHSAKAATRLAVNHSPEPFSNIGLSLAEDLAMPFGLWLVIQYPLVALGGVAVFAALFAVVAPRVFRLVRLELKAIAAAARSWAGSSGPAGRDRIDCAATPSIPQLRGSTGWLRFESSGSLVFECRRWFRRRRHEIAASDVRGLSWKSGRLLDELAVETPAGTIRFDVFKSASRRPGAFQDRLAATSRA